MKKIANFTNDDGQYQKVVLVDGTEFDLTILEFVLAEISCISGEIFYLSG